MAQQTFSGVPGAFAAGAVLTAAEQELIRDFMVALIKEGMTGDTGEILPMIMDLTNNRIVLDSGGLEFSDATTQTTAAVAGLSWSGSTANGIGTYGSSSSIVSESTATYDGTTLSLTTSGGGISLDGLNSSSATTLDDYEEGTFDVTATVASGTLTVDTVRDTLKYTKIGNRVFIMGQIEFTTASSPSGAWSLGGLPFTNTNTGSYSVNKRPNISTGIESPATDIDPGSAFGWIEANSTTITMYQSGVAATAVLNANHIDTGTHVFITGQYVCDT